MRWEIGRPIVDHHHRIHTFGITQHLHPQRVPLDTFMIHCTILPRHLISRIDKLCPRALRPHSKERERERTATI